MRQETVFADGLQFPEGPVIDGDGNLYVVELAGGRVTRFARDGKRSTVAELGGSPNGLAFGAKGELYVTNSGARWAPATSTGHKSGPGDRPGLLQRLELDGRFETVLEEIDGDPLFAPNDLCCDAEGNIWFTDPNWPDENGAVAPGSVCFTTPDGDAVRADTELIFPNGIALSPDGERLIVAESGKGRLVSFPILGPGQLGEREHYGFLGKMTIPDGFCLDASERVICAGHGTSKLFVFPPGGGDLEETVEMEDKDVTNVCFGGSDFSTLFVTESDQGRIACVEWDRPGLELPHRPG